MDPKRKQWNEKHQALRGLLRSSDHQAAIELFLAQHALLHDGAGATFSDEIWDGLSEPQARCIPASGEHSIAWLLWHLARIEDVTMNLLLAGQPQLLHQAGWYDRLGVTAQDTGNAMPAEEVVALSQCIHLDTLRQYRQAVAQVTRHNVQALTPADLKRKVDPQRLHSLLDLGAVRPEAQGVLDYWGGLTLAGLLLMPPTRHNFIHLNEALRVKQRSRKEIKA